MAINPLARKLMNALMKNGIGEDYALQKSRAALKSFPILKTKGGQPDFMEIINVLGDNAQHSTLKEARAAEKKGESVKKLKRGPERTLSLGTSALHYEIITTLPKEIINDLMIETLRDWVDFAQGRESLGGKRLKHPTGRYSRSLSLKQNNSTYKIYSMSGHADVLETGHRAFSLAKYADNFPTNRAGYHFAKLPEEGASSPKPPIARLRNSTQGRGLNVKVINSLAKVKKSYIGRYGKNPQFRIIEKDSKGWKIPRMLAYSPAWHLAQKLKLRVKTLQKVLYT